MAANGSAAYDYNQYGTRYGSAAPARQPDRRRVPAALQPRIVRKTRRQLRAETLRSRAMAIKILAAAAVLFTLIAFQIYSQVRVDELNHQLADINSQISVTESENTQLNMQLDSNVSLDKVDEYARNTLGMVKVQDYQVNYVKLSGGDTVEVSGGKQHLSLWEKIKSAVG